MAARRVGARGRTTIAIALSGFVLISAGVIWRRTAGIEQARELSSLEQRRLQLQSERAKLVSEIRDAASRGRLAPLLERRLNLHVPNDTQVVILIKSQGSP